MLKSLSIVVFVFAQLLMSAQVYAQSLPAEVKKAFDQEKVPMQNVGIMVKDINGKTILAVNANKAFAPASTMKLMTTGAALSILGPSFTWKTGAYVDGKIDDGDLEGNLYLQGSGDPQFVMEKLWLFLKTIRDKGIQTIDGNVVLDTHLFGVDDSHFVSFDDDPQNPYNAYPDAFLVNYKSLAIRLIPDVLNKKISVTVEPNIKAKVTAPQLTEGVCGDWKKQLHATFAEHKIQIDGSYPAACGEQIWYMYPDQIPTQTYFSWVFQAMWQELGGKLKGDVVSGTVPENATSFAEWVSPDLTEVIRSMNKFSNNVMARQILLTLIANTMSVPAKVTDGQQVISNWLAQQGISSDQLVVENGSGLSREARLTPTILSSVLVNMYQSPSMPEFMSSLPIIGVDGTMRKRLVGTPVMGQGHIKTGYLDDARAIAGYVRARSGKYYIVVGFVNGSKARASKDGLDTLLEWVYRQ